MNYLLQSYHYGFGVYCAYNSRLDWARVSVHTLVSGVRLIKFCLNRGMNRPAAYLVRYRLYHQHKHFQLNNKYRVKISV